MGSLIEDVCETCGWTVFIPERQGAQYHLLASEPHQGQGEPCNVCPRLRAMSSLDDELDPHP